MLHKFRSPVPDSGLKGKRAEQKYIIIAPIQRRRNSKQLSNQQQPPRSDNRYRTHRSVKCYVAKIFCGSASCTWYFQESIERVIYLFPRKIEKILYLNSFFPLRSAASMERKVRRLIGEGATVCIGGKTLYRGDAGGDFEPFPYIEAYTAVDVDTYERLRRGIHG